MENKQIGKKNAIISFHNLNYKNESHSFAIHGFINEQIIIKGF